MSWQAFPLGEVVTFKGGGTPSRDNPAYWGGSIPWATVKDFNSGYTLRTTQEFITEEGLRRSASNLIAAGTVIVPTRMALGKAVISEVDVAINQDLKAAIPIKELDPRFLLWFFLANSVQIEAMGKGATVKGVTLDQLRSLEIPLPLISEQRRIAAILDKADALRAKRREAIAKLDQLLQAVFLDMFGDPVANPRRWPVRRIDEVSECLDRLRKPVTAKDRGAGDVPYYGANGQQGWIDRSIFNESLVLVAEDGGHFDRPERGVAYRIDGPAWVNNHAHILRAKSGVLETEYLHRALRHFDFLPYISGSTRSKLTQAQLNSVPILVPPIEMQSRFAQIVGRIEQQAHPSSCSANLLDFLFGSLQQRAFTGNL